MAVETVKTFTEGAANPLPALGPMPQSRRRIAYPRVTR